LSTGGKFNALQTQAVVFAVVCVLLFLIVLAIFEQGDIDGVQFAGRHLEARTSIAGFSLDSVAAVAMILVGIAIGMTGGMLGMGGGAILVAGMLLVFGLDIYLARTVSMETMFFVSATASWHFFRVGELPRKLAWTMLAPALVGTIVGIIIGFAVSAATLTHVFGFFMLFLGFFTLAHLTADPLESLLREEFNKRPPGRHARLVQGLGVFHGLLCGLLGISGGVLTIPLQQMVLRVPARQAIAASLAVSTLCTGIGSVILVVAGIHRGEFTYVQLLPVLVFIGTGATLGAWIGARLTGQINVAVLRLLFFVVCVGSGLFILL